MTKKFRGSDAKVLVGVSLDDHGKWVLERAIQLCRRTGMRLRVTHVIKPAAQVSTYHSYYLSGDPGLDPWEYEEASGSVSIEKRAQAWDALKSFIGNIDGLQPEINVVEAHSPADGLIADAVANHASLIVVGAADRSHRFIPRGLSAALSLMAHAPMPVLALRIGKDLDLSRPGKRILVADDLTGNSENALYCGEALACALGECELVHAHAIEEDAFAPNLGDLNVFKEKIEKKLRDRMDGRRHMIEAAGGKYVTQVTSGDLASEQIAAMIERNRTDIAVFGRHHAWRTRPFAAGRISFRAMLSDANAVVVAPAIEG